MPHRTPRATARASRSARISDVVREITHEIARGRPEFSARIAAPLAVCMRPHARACRSHFRTAQTQSPSAREGGRWLRTSLQLFYMCPRRTHEVGAVSVIPETTCPHAGLGSSGKRRRGVVGDTPSRAETPPRRRRDRARPMCDGVAGRGTRRGQCTGVCPCTMTSREGASAESWGTAQDNGRAQYRRPCWAKRTEPCGLPLMR